MKKVLTIAGSDCSGGAGIQADLKTMSAHGIYGMSVITALTAQNTLGVTGILEADADFVGLQLDAIFTDIRPDAVKIGMVSNSKIIEVIAEKLKVYQAEYIVVDPVMISTSGSRLLSEEAMRTVVEKLLPLATVITPNLHEAEALTGIKIVTEQDMVLAAKQLSQSLNGDILIKGGHATGNANDLLWHEGQAIWILGERIDNANTHGTGCTLSTAIACGLSNDLSIEASVRAAKVYINGALNAQLDLGAGSGPLNHTWALKPTTISK